MWTGFLLMAAVAAPFAAAQVPPGLHPHERLRVWVSDSGFARPVVGALEAWTPTGLGLVPRGLVWPRFYLFTDLDAIEVSVGQSPVWRYGSMLAGTAVGVWLGASGRLESDRCRILGHGDPHCDWITPPAVVGGGFGLILSAIAGYFLLPERWRKLPVDLDRARPPGASVPSRGSIEFRF